MTTPSAANVAVIGAGRVGLNLLRHLGRKGMRIPAVVEPDIERHGTIRSLFPHARVLAELPPGLPHDTDICILAVPDHMLAAVVAQLAEPPALPPTALALHVSGIHDADIMRPLTAAGHLAGGMHPIQSFTSTHLPVEALENIGCGIEGGDAFWERASAFAEQLGWQPLRIAPGRKALYHAACVFAGNFPVVLLAEASRLLRTASGTPNAEELLFPMMEIVTRRLADTLPEHALSGPAARGDIEAIGRHLAALGDAFPDVLATYTALTRTALDLAPLTPEKRMDINTLLDAWGRGARTGTTEESPQP
ncbi:MAG: DUF2520 domain-containing protein [Bacteroidetes bacterium]|nr:DUF2520 domain-containing protein [Bacteroidota bacterium]